MSDKYNEKRLTRLGITVMMVAVLAVTALVGYASFEEEDDEVVTVFAGLENDTLQVRSAVMAEASTGFCVGEINFVLSLADGAEPVDFRMTSDTNANGVLSDEGSATHTVVVSYFDKSQRVDDLTWKAEQYGPGDGDSILETGENFRLTVGADVAGNAGLLCNALTPELGAGSAFTVEVTTPNGEILSVERVMPDSLQTIMILE